MDPYAQQFWNYTQKKEFRLQQCSDCKKFRFPPGPTCDACLSDNFEWALMGGRGKVLSWTTFRRAYFPEYPAAVRLVPGRRSGRRPARRHGAVAAVDGRSGQIRRIQPAGVRSVSIVAVEDARLR
jgi:hypothetical protein